MISKKKKKKKKKKKGLRQNTGRFFFQFRKLKRMRGGSFRMGGGLFSIFHRKSASKAQKTCDFAYFTSQWGGLEPPPPPLATLLMKSVFPKHLLCISVLPRKSRKTFRTCTHERFLKFFVAIEVLPFTSLKKHVWSDLACSNLFLLNL